VSRFLWRWGPALLWTGILFAVSSQPTLPVDLVSGTDKLAHFAAYSVLGFLLARGQFHARLSVLWPLVIGSLIGGLDEIYQSTVSGRQMDLADWVADTLGVIAGVVVYHTVRRRIFSRDSRHQSMEQLPHE
jgi:VanZ family protein